MDSSFDPKDFRQALGMFATGVTIVTTRAPDGSPVGITANSFNSVSLDPPLVLWSLARNAKSLPAFTGAQHWNVHILANDQRALSGRFARAGTDKFAGLALDEGSDGTPLLRGCSARFECRTLFQYDGGDHVIFVGQVTGYERSEHPPLLYVTGDYALAVRMAGAIATEAGTDPANEVALAQQAAGHPYSEDMLGYLLGRSHYQFMAGFRSVLARQDLSDTEFYVLSLLAIRAPLGAADIAQHMAYTGCDAGAEMLAGLCARGLLEAEAAARYRLTADGRAAILQVLAAARQTEAHLAEHLGPIETAALRNLLKRLVAASDPGLPLLWPAP
ncbi:peptidase [Cupriavidus necator]|uniref:Peptidase n=1 Tax=Cupriavidus necator TaxID=106590 RepID=A0A1U9V031_CUPNE|nr:flavin reductase [Cupriavidus necator]AQV98292.1 peptidase [Cupriavidus necator]